MTPAKRVYATTSFTVNGRTYASVDEMPADVRRHYEETLRMLTTDRDGNGVPDAFEAASDDPDVKQVVIGSASQRIWIRPRVNFFDTMLPRIPTRSVSEVLPQDLAYASG